MVFNPRENYETTLKNTGYVTRQEATKETYTRIGFKSGLEVHQQLLTKEKLFCHCPAGIYNKSKDYDAELIRHMRPTLSELGEYDGTALMEFKTRKEIVYRIKNNTACTYEIDDTPPFLMNKEALNIALEISLLSKLNIVGEVHITRKQYLDGSIPTGFQRTAIIGVEGEIDLPYKKIRLIQLSIEEDSCREISDIGHTRIFKTDRLGMPLIETVTYPDCLNPDEVKDTCDYIRFLNRSTDKVRTGMGAGRQDVNVSCKGGTRVEIKGVAHSKWIPELTHNEVFRQWALLRIKALLKKRVNNVSHWKMTYIEIKPDLSKFKNSEKVIAINLPHFSGILSHFTQPGKTFADEITDRLKVIACLEKPNLRHTEEFEPDIKESIWNNIKSKLKATKNDAQIIIWGSEDDMPTAIETVEERCIFAFKGVPNETRKSSEDGTSIFERVLPGADRMYPDTDTSPIPLDTTQIEEISTGLPEDIINRYNKLKAWGIPEETYTYLFAKNHFLLIERIIKELDVPPKYIGTYFGHKLKFAEGHYKKSDKFEYPILFNLFEFLKQKRLHWILAEKMLPVVIEHPMMDFESILTSINFKQISQHEILAKIPFLKKKFRQNNNNPDKLNEIRMIMGQLRNIAMGNIDLKELSNNI